MAASPVEEIKEKIDIVDFLRGYLTLSPAGKNFKALCPFHKEKTPSFMISPERQSWHCFGCALGGDAFSFLMRYENLEFGDALRVLAERAGVELRRLNPAEYKFTGLLFELNQVAKDFFRDQLAGSNAAKDYLKQRKLAPGTIEAFELGWAPNEPEALTLHLLKAGYRPEDLLAAGLSFKTERGMQIDRFRGRIMFPIHNHFGKVVGFTGRVLPQFESDKTGKYVNSPETAIFNKSKLLYGLWLTKNAIREAGEVFMVEGQMDMLMSWQAGVKNTVASSGTALTSDHLRALRRLADKMLLCFDNDEAGMAAGERAIDLASSADFQVKVVSLKGHKDPGEAAEKDPEGFRAAVKDARPAPEFYFSRYLSGTGRDPRDREFLRSLRVVLAKLGAIPSPVERDFWIKELSRRVSIEEKILLEEFSRLDQKGVPAPAAPEDAAREPARLLTRRELLSQMLLSAMLPDNRFDLLGDHAQYLAAEYREVLAVMARGERRSSDPRLDGVLNLVILRSAGFAPEEVEKLKKHLYEEYLKERRRELTLAVKQAELRNDREAEEAALAELQSLPSV